MTYDEIIHPIGARAESDAVGTVGEGPYFGDEDPGAGSPGIPEVDYEEPDHGDGGPAGGRLGGPLVAVFGDEDSDDDVAVQGWVSCDFMI